MTKINWLILSSSNQGIQYGVGTFIRELSLGLSERKNIAVFVLEIGFSGRKTFEIRKDENGITFFEIPLVEKTYGMDSRKNQKRFAKSIARVVTQFIPSADITVVQMNFLFQYFIANELKQNLQGIVLYTQHVFTQDQKLNFEYFDTERKTYEMTDYIITVTRHGRDHLINKGIISDKIKVIYNGISAEQFDTKQDNYKVEVKYGLNRNEKLLLYSGRIHPVKGLNYLIAAFELLLKRIPDCRLVIAGNGDSEDLKKATSHLRSHIRFLGFIPFEDIISLYQITTIGVIPSLEEHCSYVALEMLFCGLPVVASKQGGLKEIFIERENALLVDMVSDRTNLYGTAPKIDQISEFIYELFGNDQLRKGFSQNSRARAKVTFTRDIMVDEYLKLITKKRYES